MKLTTFFDNDKEKELEFSFKKDEADNIVLSFLQKNGLIDNKDKCKLFYLVDETDIVQLVKVEEYIEEIKAYDIISANINKIEFKINDNREKFKLFKIFVDYICDNFKYLFNTSNMESYSIDYYISDQDEAIIIFNKRSINV